jgi:hypothetical protein
LTNPEIWFTFQIWSVKFQTDTSWRPCRLTSCWQLAFNIHWLKSHHEHNLAQILWETLKVDMTHSGNPMCTSLNNENVSWNLQCNINYSGNLKQIWHIQIVVICISFDNENTNKTSHNKTLSGGSRLIYHFNKNKSVWKSMCFLIISINCGIMRVLIGSDYEKLMMKWFPHLINAGLIFKTQVT